MIRVDFIRKDVIFINLLMLTNSVYKLARNKSQVNNRIQEFLWSKMVKIISFPLEYYYPFSDL